VPVFVFLAPSNPPDRVFCVNITLWSTINALPESKTKRIWSDCVLCLTSEEARAFLHHALPITYTINLCRLYGFIASIPQVSEAYERKELTGYQAAFAEEVVPIIKKSLLGRYCNCLGNSSTERRLPCLCLSSRASPRLRKHLDHHDRLWLRLGLYVLRSLKPPARVAKAALRGDVSLTLESWLMENGLIECMIP